MVKDDLVFSKHIEADDVPVETEENSHEENDENKNIEIEVEPAKKINEYIEPNEVFRKKKKTVVKPPPTEKETSATKEEEVEPTKEESKEEPPTIESRQEMPEPENIEPEMAETKDDRQEIKEEIASSKQAGKNVGSNIREQGDTEEREGKTEESSGESKGNEKESKQVKVDTKAEVPSKPNASETKVKATLPVNTVKPQTIEQLPLPIAYLQIINDSISMVETVSLRQEQIYGGEQEYNLNTSSITIAGLDNNSSSRWSNLQNERKRFKAPKYVRRNK